MKELVIEWRHYDKLGETCERCASTGGSVQEVVAELRRELSGEGVSVTFIETLLAEEQMSQSNLLLFNGIPLESLLEQAVAGENSCPSCSCLTGSETSCRTVTVKGTTYEEIPAELIRKAAYKSLA